MPMEAEVHKVGEELNSATSKAEQQAILNILDQNMGVILDLSGCKYVSSAGLRVMLYSYKVAAAAGLSVWLAGVSKEVREVMAITGFEHFFRFFDTVEECQKAAAETDGQ